MSFEDMGSYAVLNPYDVSYIPLKFVPLILNHPVRKLMKFRDYLIHGT